MTKSKSLNPYAGNILIEAMGSIPSPEDALASLMYLPEIPRSMDGVPKHIRLHLLMSLRDFHLPSLAERQLLQTIDMMVRQGYRYRDPKQPQTWSVLSGEESRRSILIPQAQAASVEGFSGVGKTQACLRCLNIVSPQNIQHKTFPHLKNGLLQTVWLSVEVPPSGKAVDFARDLMIAWQSATGSERFEHHLSKDRNVNAMTLLNEWRQVASTHFLGVLHLDEVQNLFRQSSLRQRKESKGKESVRELSIVEDKLLGWLLSSTNRGTPMLYSGTPDGIGALSKRFSTSQRTTTGGYHAFEPFSNPRDKTFTDTFLATLGKYQFVKQPIVVDQALADLIVELTGGIQRLIIALWIAAHRVAFERKSDDLRIADFRTAAKTWLAPVAPAVAALHSKDAYRMAQYEDLIRRDTTFWQKFWQDTATLNSQSR